MVRLTLRVDNRFKQYQSLDHTITVYTAHRHISLLTLLQTIGLTFIFDNTSIIIAQRNQEQNRSNILKTARPLSPLRPENQPDSLDR